jgi:hypothetical protein
MANGDSPKRESKVPIIATVIVAIIALIATVIAGSISGRYALEGIKASFSQQRQAQVQDLRRTTYVSFLQSAEKAYQAKDGTPHEPALKSSRDLVLIVGTPEVREKANALVLAALAGKDKEYSAARVAFVDSAQREADQALN